MVDKYEDLIVKYKERIKKDFGDQAANPVTPPSKITSKEYSQFKSELFPKHYGFYEKMCNSSEKILKMNVDGKQAKKIQKHLDLCHLNVTPSGVISFSLLAPMIIMIFGSLIIGLVETELGK